jgi:hypothetical protein
MTNYLTAKRGFVGKVAVWLLLTLGAVLLAVVVMGSTPQPAPAQGALDCGQPEEGNWVNSGSVDFVTRINLRCVALPTSTGGVAHRWTVEVWVVTTCGSGPGAGAQCIVNWPPKDALGYTPSGKIHVLYNHEFSTDNLYANMSQYKPGQLWVGVTREGKGAQQGIVRTTDGWFIRA